MTLLDRLRRLPLPTGTIPVGVGLGLAGLMQYGFLAVAARALGQTHFAPLSVFWALLFVCGPGFFLPIEQETGRAIAARRVRGEGGRPIMERAALLGTALAVVLVITTLALAGPIDRRVFDGDPALLAALIAGFVAYLVQFLARGTLAGNGRFGSYGVAMIIASVLAIAMATIGRRRLFDPGPPAPWSELSSALGFLLVASVFTQLLASVGAVAVQLLATPAQEKAAGQFLLSRIVAYVPLFLFQAVQSALLPRLSSLATAGRHAEFRSLLFRLLTLVGALGVVAVAGFTILGPAVTRLLFGHGFELSSLDFALLSASCIGLIVTQVFGYALIALSSYRRVALGWVVGGLVFIGVAALGSQLFLRVELGLLCGALASSAVMAALLLSLLRERASSDTEPRIAEAHPA